MKQEYKDKLNKMNGFFDSYKSMQYEEYSKKCIECFDVFINELAATKDQEILNELILFFDGEFEDYFECIIEHLKSQIEINYSLDQILEAFYKKFDLLIKNDIEICVEMSMWFFDGGRFEDFRRMFNAVKSEKSELFLQEFEEWYPDLKNKITLLKEDMKKW